MSRLPNSVSWLLLSLLLAAGTAAADPPWWGTAEVQSGTWSPSFSAQGRVRAWRAVTLRAPAALTLDAVAVSPGQYAVAHQALAQVTPGSLWAPLANLREGEERVGLLQRRVDTVRQLRHARVSTRKELLQVETELSRARSEQDAAWQTVHDILARLGQSPDRAGVEQQLRAGSVAEVAGKLSVIRAPISGVIVERAADAGSRVERGGPMFRLEDLSRVVVNVEVPRTQAKAWLHGTPRVQGPRGAPIELKTLTEVPRVDPQTGLARLRFEAPNGDGQILSGQWLTVHLEEPPREVFWVPAIAVVGRAGKTYCIRREHGRFEPVRVTAGPEQDGRVPVLQGLAAGDRVVTKGAYLLLYRDLNQLMQFQD